MQSEEGQFIKKESRKLHNAPATQNLQKQTCPMQTVFMQKEAAPDSAFWQPKRLQQTTSSTTAAAAALRTAGLAA